MHTSDDAGTLRDRHIQGDRRLINGWHAFFPKIRPDKLTDLLRVAKVTAVAQRDYGVGVGHEGFTWSGVKTVERNAEWPDWTPPAEMIAPAPYLPRFMAGGAANPLGARAMYLSGTFYRIHGTNAPSTIGSRARVAKAYISRQWLG
jgi:hypothetical protein